MPDSGNPGVSVFHFTSRISNAKIRKYKQATERGMSSGTKDVPGTPAYTTTVSNPPSDSGEPSTKRQRTSSHTSDAEVLAPAALGDPLATSRPKRGSALKFRYSDNMVISAEDRATAAWEITSELSSLPSTPQVEPVSAKDQEHTPPSEDEDYGMLSTYYIMDDEEDNVTKKTLDHEVPESPTTPPPPSVPLSALKSPDQLEGPPESVHPVATNRQPHLKKKQDARRPKKVHTLSHPDHHVPSMHAPLPQATIHHPPPPPIVPRVVLMEMNFGAGLQKSREHVTVEEMVKCVDALSAALSVFSRVPFVPGPSKPMQATNSKHTKSAKQKADKVGAVDDFLSMIDSISDDDQDDVEAEASLSHPGQPDESLMYGIQFIQNALKSWAHQRLQSMIAQHTMDQWYEQQVQQSNRRGPGRPRKSDYGTSQQELSPTVHMNLEIQPEGRAILAFHEVLQCGALQVNGVLPHEMARALTQLYMQIDHLINNGHNPDPPFVCMSYGAQQAAHRSRLQKAKEDLTRIQEEFELYHKNGAHHAFFPHHMPFAHGQHYYHAGSGQDHQAGHSPANPILLGSQPASLPLASGSSHMIVSGDAHQAQVMHLGQAQHNQQISVQSRPVQPTTDIEAGLLPRSGQQMKFSFSPRSEQVERISGPAVVPEGILSGQDPLNTMPQVAPPSKHMPGPGPPPPPQQSAANAIMNDANGVTNNLRGKASDNLTHDANRKVYTANSVIDISSDIEPPTELDNIVVAPVSKGTGFTAINATLRPPPSTRSEISTNRPRKDVPESRPSAAMRGSRRVDSISSSRSKQLHASAVVVDQ